MSSFGRQYTQGCNRHTLHLFTYGAVSLSLIVMGGIFSGFAIFAKRSVIGQIWLAGPTTIAVGLVLCGKVIIDFQSSPRRSAFETDDGLEDTLDEETALDMELNYATDPNKALLTSIDAEYDKKKNRDGILIANFTAKDETSDSAVDIKLHSPEEPIWNPRTDAHSLLIAYQAPTNLASTRIQALCMQNQHSLMKEVECESRPQSVSSVDVTSPRASISGTVHGSECSTRDLAHSPELSIQTPLYLGERFILQERQYRI